MYTDLGTARLRSGETMTMGCVLGPDEAFTTEVPNFLGHKNEHCQWHIEKSMAEALDGLETRFYLGRIEEEIITSIMTVELAGCGILGHVFTQPNHRRKGACKLLMEQQMDDFRRRGGRCLILGTGYDTHPYYIYEGFGFASIEEASGDMRYTTGGDEAFIAMHFAPGEAAALPVAWHHWPMISVLSSFAWGERLRLIVPPCYGAFNYEGQFYPLKRACEAGRGVQAHVLESPKRAVVGFAALQPDGRFRGETWVLDLLVHPSFADEGAKLLAVFEMPDAKVQAYADKDSEPKIAFLEQGGFRAETILAGQLRANGEPLDVVVLARD